MIIALFIFLLLSTLLIYANLKINHKSDSTINAKISVIVAAKNEEENISKLITSLSTQYYPKENYEVIIIDDNSTDQTYETIKNNISNFPNFRLLKAADKKYIGKRGALQIGIEHAKHPNLLITDADCRPKQNWIKEFASKFNSGFDFIFGAAPYEQQNSFVNKIACFENLRTHILTFGSEKIGLPYSAAARSFGFRKEAFIKIGGYKNTIQTLSGDDDLLLREAIKNNLNIGVITEPEAFVFTRTKNTFAEYSRQKARHTSTANYYSLTIKILLGFWHILNLLFLFSPLLMFIDLRFGIFFLVKIITDFIIIKLLMKNFSYRFSTFEIIYLQVIYEFMLILNYVKGTFGKREW